MMPQFYFSCNQHTQQESCISKPWKRTGSNNMISSWGRWSMCFGVVLISFADGYAFTQKHTSSLISKSYVTTTNRQKYFRSTTRRNFSFSLSSSSNKLDEFTSNVEPKNTLPPQTPTTDSFGPSTSPPYEKDTLKRLAKDVAIVLKVMCAAEQDPDIPGMSV
eukprot:scaffold673671_cov51-Attheya_sp.AAC.1